VKRLLIRVFGKVQQLKTHTLTPNFPEIEKYPELQIVALGSEYGKKFLALLDLPQNPLLISGGVGEDVSFDVEFVNSYSGEVLLFDPTPRAVAHFQDMTSRYGRRSETAYSKDGRQPIESYSLENVSERNVRFFEYALLNSPRKVNFYEPPVKSHVSYSVQNIQNSFKKSGSYIEVDAIGPKEVLSLANNRDVDILKLDIEGSEYEFLSASFGMKFLPKQILVEIDELHFPSLRTRRIAKKLLKLLEINGYTLVFRDGFNFTYCRNNLLQ
jgi:FkbM family methyltransferase